ncbi:MAG: TIGR01777 family protein [Micromonosporaceae bacterium]|nr:TIGR01777 family protein [Micromonosporaceae bacterium]
MRVVIAGASGFLGTNLTERLRGSGHEVIRLVRRPARAQDELTWDPSRRELDPAAFEDADAVINLAGAGIGDKRWDEDYKKVIRRSRVDPTATLAEAIAARGTPTVLLNASAVGYYGDTGEHAVDEDAPRGEGFLQDVARDWEAATEPAAEAGARVVRLRTAPVLAASGGLLKGMLPFFRLGLGGPLASGRQHMAWISLADWLSAVEFLFERPGISGPVNLSSPYPPTNREFTRALGEELGRPAILPAPWFGLRLLLGEFADEVVASQRVLPSVLTRHGFRFAHADLGAALRWALAH